MSARRLIGVTLVVWATHAVLTPPPVGHAGLMDAVKKKLNDKAAKKAEQAVDKATEQPEKKTDGNQAARGQREVENHGARAKVAGGKVSAVSTKFDFVPGDKVMLFDDFTQDDLGEFPARWRLTQGTFEVVEFEGERWFRCTSNDGRVRMKLPAMASLPEFWTLELDFFGEEPLYNALVVSGLTVGQREESVWRATFPSGSTKGMSFQTGNITAATALDGEPPMGGRHHMMFMARGTALKAYVDGQRLVSVPEIDSREGAPGMLEFRFWSDQKPMITNVRFAEGCRPAKDMLAEGKLVTYGIRFESGSDAVLPESAPVLRQIASYMEANPAVKLKITGHTDNVGSPASNLDLSKRRSASVAKVLSDQFGVAADRFTTDGQGDTRIVASNAKPEGRAMNRRVEFEKL